jgi:hypothetical protein
VISKRNGANHPDATRGSPSQSHHVRADGGLVDKHQPGRIKHTLLSYPAAARSRHICSLPLVCLQYFFDSRSRKRQSELRLVLIRRLRSSATVSRFCLKIPG